MSHVLRQTKSPLRHVLNKACCALATLVTSCAAAGSFENTPWIGDGRPDTDGADWYDESPAPEFRAEFVLPEGVSETKVRFACAGFGWFTVNGRPCLNVDGLDTFWSPYDKTVYAMESETLKAPTALKPYPQKNIITVGLGNGFYNMLPLRFWGKRMFRMDVAHGRPCFKLIVDGVEKPLDWRWRQTKIVRNSPYLGTEIDATRADDDNWQTAVAVKGPKGRIAAWPRNNPQMKTLGVDRGVAKWLKPGEVQVVDFGVNASGVSDFVFEGEARGTSVEIVYGERLNDDGSVNVLTQTAGQVKKPGKGGPGAPGIACQRDVYVCGGERAERFNPPFTWHICRYAEIRCAKNLVKEARRNVRSMVADAKPIDIDDPMLKAIHEISVRTFQANLVGGVQSDCPGRERLGYGGDIVATCEAMCLNFDMSEIYLKILRDFADEAEDDGFITETAPYVGIAVNGFGGRSGPIGWSLGVPVMMDALIRHYPKVKARALKFYPVCARYVRLVDAKCPDGYVATCIGDHETLDRVPNDCIATAHWHEFVRLTEGFAKMLGCEDDVREFAAIGEKIRLAFVGRFVKRGVVANGTQSAQALALYLGLVPENEIAAAEAQLMKKLEDMNFAPTTGIFATRYMLMYLSEHGRLDIARRIVMHEGFPGWRHMLDRGATTLWETWKESDNIYSNCHPMFGSVDEWIRRFGSKR